MVLEAVPCVFRSNQEGNETCFGYLIRSSDETASTSSSGPRTTSVSMPAVVPTSPPLSNSNPGPSSSSSNPTTSRSITPSSASTAPLLMQGFHPNGAPIVVNPVNGEHPPKILVPANIQVRLQSTASGPSIPSDSSTSASNSWPLPPNTKVIPITSGGGSFVPPNAHNTMSSPCPSQPRSISVCSASPLTDTSPMSPNLVAYPYSSSSAHHSQIPGNSRGVRPQPAAASRPVQGNGNNTDSSTTPDSGIQSVPTSPPDSQQLSPPTMEPCDSVCEVDTYDRVDYDDMPRLFPADQEDEEDTTPSSSSFPPALREDGLSHGSECETTPAPTISITRTMGSDEIVDKLIELAPDKISLIANLIKKKTIQQRKRKSNPNLTNTSPEAPVLEPITKRKRRESAGKIELKPEPQAIEPTPELVKSEKKRGRKKKQSEQTLVNIPSMPKLERPEDEVPTEAEDVDAEYDIKTYRKAMKKMLQDMLVKNVERITSDIGELHICRDRHDKKLQKDKIKMWNIDWAQVKLRSKKREEQRKKLTLEAEKDKEKSKRIAKVDAGQKLTGKLTPITLKLKKAPENEAEVKRRKTSPTTPRKRGSSESRLRSEATSSCEKKPPETRDGEVQTSFSDGRIPHWEAPLLRCGCTRGACTSDAECINRALCVQCSSSCDAPLCANKKFWKRDATKYLIASGPKTKRVLRTRQARRAGEFLCEFAGEVISYDEAVKRISDYSSDPQTPPRILCLSSRLFIDATIRSNIGRYVRHSCRPNSRIEVWTVGGRLRAGIFSLFDIASGAEITIDMDRLLPVERECHCDASNCKKTLRVARNAVLANSSELSLSEEKSVKDGQVFLLRNRRKTIERAMKHGVPQEFVDNFGAKSCSPASLRQIVIGLLYRMRRIDGSLPYIALRGYTRVESILREVEREKSLEGNFDIIESFKTQIQKWLDEVDDDDLDRVYTALRQRYLDDKLDDKKGVHQNSARKRENSKKVRPETDLSYLFTKDLVGSYNPDADACANSKGMKKTTDEDAVRCICGSLEEDGEMLQCDSCHYWLHLECLDDIDQDTDYKCAFCSGAISQPSLVDVPLKKPPEFTLPSCVYYKALMNRRSIQVRLNETVYVLRTQGDEHKKILRKLESHDKKKKDTKDEDEIPKQGDATYSPVLYERKELRIFRIERLFSAPGNHRFVFGFYYAYPHETYSRDVRQFHKNEVFATPLYDTLPLDFVVGRCVVLDSPTFGKGRPIVPKFKESDVYVCDYQIDRSQKVFEKIPTRDHYPINTQPYVFEAFPQKQPVVRDFTPFIVPDNAVTCTPSRLSSAKQTEQESPTHRELKDLRTSYLSSIISKKFPQSTLVKNRHGRKRLNFK